MPINNIDEKLEETLVKLAYLHSELKLLVEKKQTPQYKALAKEIADTEKEYKQWVLLKMEILN